MKISSFVKDHVVDDEWSRIRSTRILDLQRRSLPFVAAAAAEHPSSRRRQGRQRTCQPPERRDRLLRLLDEALATSGIGICDGGASQANTRV